MILTVTLNPVLDKNYIVEDFALTGIHRVETMSNIAAGKGINVSRVLAQLNCPTTATGILGGHTGKLIEAKLRQQKIATDFVRIRAESRCSILVTDHTKKTHTELIEPGPKIPRGAFGRLNKKLEALLPLSSWVVFSGSPPPDTSAQVYYQLIKLAQDYNVKVALDTRGQWLQEGVKAVPNLIKPNWDEFRELVGPCYSTVQAIEKARRVADNGIDTIIISMGSKGALAIRQESAYAVHTLPAIDVVSPVGSGDTLVAGFLAGETQGLAFPDSFQFALALATANVENFGAGLIDLKRAAELQPQIIVEQIPY